MRTGCSGWIPGDANGDGFFDSNDLLAVLQPGEYEDSISGNSTFAEGDWNGDGDFATADLVFAMQAGRYVQIPLAESLAVADIPSDLLARKHRLFV